MRRATRVRARADQRLRGFAGHDVAADDLQRRVALLDPRDAAVEHGTVLQQGAYPTTHMVNATPMTAPPIAPPTAHCGARSANTRLSVSATPSPKAAPNSSISRVSEPPGRSGATPTSNTGRDSAGSTTNPSSSPTSAS